MSKEEYYKYIEENDFYPEHSHQWIVRTYTDAGVYNPNEVFYRNFGPFSSKEEASKFIAEYKMKYTTKGFITRCSIEAMCGVL